MGEDMREVQEAKEEINEKYRGLKEDATDAKLVEFADYLEKKYEDIKEATKSKVSVEMKKFLESGLVKIYMKILKSVMSVVKHGKEQEKASATVQAMLTFKKLSIMEQATEEKTAETLKKYIVELGFIELAKKLNMVKEKEKVEVKKEQSFARFQLRHMGMHLDHEAPATRDRRVDKFNPDLWQRQLFDVVDHRESALIIAPTSIRKSYGSHNVMEMVLQENDEGMVAYVGPTKALANQMAATVYTRSSGRKRDLSRGRAGQDTFTRRSKEGALNRQGPEILLL